MQQKTLNIISLGLGVQSTAMYYMSSMGQLPRADYAIFADPGKEKKGTIEYLEFLQKWQQENNGIPIIVYAKRNLYKDILTGKRFTIPAFTKGVDGVGMLRRQCTTEYKIYQVQQALRQIYGLKFRQRMPKTSVWIGITLDEIERMSIPSVGWETKVYPFCGYKVTKKDTIRMDDGLIKTRSDLQKFYNINNLPVPPKSACVFCPYQSDNSWSSLKRDNPEDFKAAIKVDEAIRNSTKLGVNNPVYLHRSLIPLSEIDFKPGLPDLWHGECSGNCHV